MIDRGATVGRSGWSRRSATADVFAAIPSAFRIALADHITRSGSAGQTWHRTAWTDDRFISVKIAALNNLHKQG